MINTVKVNNNQAAFVMLLKEFIESYAQNQYMPLNQWLAATLSSHMPEKSPSEIHTITTGILSTLESIQAKRDSLDRSISRGRTKSEWFAQQLNTSPETVHELHTAAVNAQRDILTKTGVIDAEFADTSPQTPPTPHDTAREIQNAAVLGSTVEPEGYDLAGEVLRDFASPYSKFVTDALKSGDTTGLKAAASGAVKTASERGMLPAMPAGTSEHVITGVGHMAIEKVKAYAKKLPFVDVVEKVERDSLSVAGDMLKFANELGSLGAAIGSVFGPVGAVVGGVVGGVTGFVAGTAVAQTVVEKTKEVRRKVIDTVSSYVAPVLKRASESVKITSIKIRSLLFS